MTGSSALLVAALITLLGSSAIGLAAALASLARSPRMGSTTALAGTILAAILLFSSLAARTAVTGHAPEQ